jgi:hypothetical protein
MNFSVEPKRVNRRCICIPAVRKSFCSILLGEKKQGKFSLDTFLKRLVGKEKKRKTEGQMYHQYFKYVYLKPYK